MVMSIQYLDLSRERSEIRLLQLLPNPGAQYARIPCCRLLQTGLRDAPPYKALSYAWGNANKNRVIRVDDIGIRIPENLFNALIALRPSEFPSLMWVDYLCIDQRNDTEKAWQVALMGDIYKRADQVIAWLGPGDSESRRAIEYLDELGEEAYSCGFYHNLHIGDTMWRELARYYARHPDGFTYDSSFTYLQQVLGVYTPIFIRLGNLFRRINGLDGKGKYFPVREMNNMLQRPWFGRVWVLQEIALSREAIFICGTMKINRRKLAAALNAYQCFSRTLFGMLKDLGTLNSYHYQIILSGHFIRASMMANGPRVRMSNFPLIALLRLTCVGSPNLQKHGPHHLDSSDPRDKIFALLGLAFDREDLSEKGINPDYGKSYREVYSLTTSALLQQGHISLLSLVQPHRRSIVENLPSWVPNWHQPITEPLQIVEDDHMTLEPEFYASGKIHPLPIVKVNSNTSAVTYGISLKGFICDKVHSVGYFPNRISSWDVPLEKTSSWPQEWLVEILRLTYQTRTNFPSFRERLHAVARASLAGVKFDLKGYVVRTGEDILLEATHLLRQSIRRVKDRHIRIEVRKFLAQTGTEEAFSSAKILSMQMPNEIIGRSLKRLPFITETGRLGLGYDNIKAGDVVTIIRGAQVPYILRLQQTGKYNLVSEAYVDQIMDGEALQGATFAWLDIV
ncbi:HET-domain-containing protein [Nemania diffusa]|nr:HET-domain-containing protein [Nemania diffusa]